MALDQGRKIELLFLSKKYCLPSLRPFSSFILNLVEKVEAICIFFSKIVSSFWNLFFSLFLKSIYFYRFCYFYIMSSNDKSDQSSDGDDDGDFIPSETDDDEEGNHSLLVNFLNFFFKALSVREMHFLLRV